MKLITVTVGQSQIARFKAPKNMMYFVEAVSLSVNVLGANNAFLIDYSVEDEVTTVDLNNAIFQATLNVQENVFVDHIDHKTKFLTFGTANTTSALYTATVYGELVKATRIDLIWEWFRKGR